MKKKIECPREEDNLRTFLLTLLNNYKVARKNMEIPLDVSFLQKLLEEIDISFYKLVDEETIGTFQVNHREINVVKENFDKNSSKRNIFLLLHELTHLSSPLNKECFESKQSMNNMKNEYKLMLDGKNNDLISDFDVYRGAIAVDEVLAQYCAEEANDFMKEKKRDTKTITQTIMGEPITVKTDFSDNDMYSPLQQYVEDLSLKLGFDDFKSFAKCILTGEKRLNDLISSDTVEQLGYIGILCEGIYQDNKLENFNLPSSDIPNAIKRLDNIRKNQSALPDSPNK